KASANRREELECAHILLSLSCSCPSSTGNARGNRPRLSCCGSFRNRIFSGARAAMLVAWGRAGKACCRFVPTALAQCSERCWLFFSKPSFLGERIHGQEG